MTHPLKAGYLVVGLIFVGLAGTWFLTELDVIEAKGLQWLLPAILLGAGLAGLAGSIGKGIAQRSEPAFAPEVNHDYRTDDLAEQDITGEDR